MRLVIESASQQGNRLGPASTGRILPLVHDWLNVRSPQSLRAFVDIRNYCYDKLARARLAGIGLDDSRAARTKKVWR